VEAYLASRQTMGDLFDLARELAPLHVATETSAMIMCLVLAVILRREPVGMFCAAVLLALIGNAILAGALSSVHERYQARLAWLAVFAAWMAAERWWALGAFPAASLNAAMPQAQASLTRVIEPPGPTKEA
jgi:hypothetical protein